MINEVERKIKMQAKVYRAYAFSFGRTVYHQDSKTPRSKREGIFWCQLCLRHVNGWVLENA